MFKNTSHSYGHFTKVIHWLMAFLLIGMFILAYIMTNMEKSDFKYFLYDIHKATGLVLFAIFLIRLGWFFHNPQPKFTASPWQQRAAKWNKINLYLFMFAMPVTGFLCSVLSGYDVNFYNLFTIPAITSHPLLDKITHKAHEIVSYFLIAAFVLHVLGALHHHFFLKDNVLKRMWFGHK